MPAPTDEFDSPWKDAIQQYFQEFVELCFPQIAKAIDWARTPESLEEELRAISPDSTVSAQRVDHLMRVWRADTGQEQMVLLHIEVQSQGDSALAQRLFQYHYRLRDTHVEPVVTLCVLADEAAGFRPECYAWDLWDCRIRFEFPTCKLLDMDVEELRGSGNLIGVIVAAHRYAQLSRRDQDLRFQLRWALVISLYERGLTRVDIFRMYRLIAWILRLEGPKKLAFSQKLTQYERRNHMAYIIDTEEVAIERGKMETNRHVIKLLLGRRFGEVPQELSARVEALNEIEVLERLLLTAMDCSSLAEFEASLPENA